MVLLFMMDVNLYGLVSAPTCCEGAFGKANFNGSCNFYAQVMSRLIQRERRDECNGIMEFFKVHELD